MGTTNTPIYQVGDLVKCVYDLFDHYQYFWDQAPSHGYPFHGIIIGIQEGLLPDESIELGYEKLYIVRCFDGHVRFFAYWEMKLVSTTSS